jgi:hypothetical protein
MKAMQKGAAILAAVALAPFTLSGCGNNDEVTAPSTNGSISILTSTSGDVVSGSYTVRVDDGMERSVEPNGTLIYTDVEPGDYEVILLSVPSNCVVEGSNPRSVTVATDEIARTTFVVTCTIEPPSKPGDPGEPPAN